MAGNIVDFASLEAAVADYAKRKDQDFKFRIPDFIQTAHITIQEYVGRLGDFTGDPSSINDMIIYDPYVYLWGAMVEAGGYLRDPEITNQYNAKYQNRLAKFAQQGGFDLLRPTPGGVVL